MAAAKKMRQVPDEVYQRLISGNFPDPNRQLAVPPKPPERPVTELINDPSVPIDKKWKMIQDEWYRNHERMLSAKKSQEPIKVQIEKETAEVEEDGDNTKTRSMLHRKNVDMIPFFLSKIPTSIRKKATEMFQFLAGCQGIGWNNSGTIVVDDTEIPRTDISNLVKHAAKPLGNAPTGWNEFKSVLLREGGPVISSAKTRKSPPKTPVKVVAKHRLPSSPSVSSTTPTPRTRRQTLNRDTGVSRIHYGSGKKGSSKKNNGRIAKRRRKQEGKRFGWKTFG